MKEGLPQESVVVPVGLEVYFVVVVANRENSVPVAPALVFLFDQFDHEPVNRGVGFEGSGLAFEVVLGPEFLLASVNIPKSGHGYLSSREIIPVIVKRSAIMLPFTLKSRRLSVFIEGDILISISHGFRFESISTSNPNT